MMTILQLFLTDPIYGTSILCKINPKNPGCGGGSGGGKKGNANENGGKDNGGCDKELRTGSFAGFRCFWSN